MDVLMPQLGETVDKGKVTVWFKKVGDAVKPGENLFEIETDKVSMEIQAIAAGTLAEIRVAAGDEAPVGAIVAIISGDGSVSATSTAVPATAPKAPSAAPIQSAHSRASGNPAAGSPPSRGRAESDAAHAQIVPAPAPRPAAGKIELDPYFEVRTPSKNYGPAQIGGRATTPLARRLAAESGIDLAGLKGSGPHGRIVAKDLDGAAPARGTASIAPAFTPAQIAALYKDVPHEEVALDGMRKTIATRLVQAKQTIPHFYLTADVEIGALLKLREQANESAPHRDGKPAFKLSVNDFVIKAWAAALLRVPAANAIWAEDRILRFRRADVAVAVAIEGGLITPLIREADTKRLTAISAEMKDLAARARDRKLKPHEYQGGSSAISNLGMYGVREFSAIINPPHGTILAVGGVRRQAVEREDGGVAFASMMTVTLSCDHRVVDGALGAELLAAFKDIVEKPIAALV